MYVGHAGIALGAKGLWPRLPLLFFLLAAYSVDLLEVACLALGLEEAVPNPVETLPVALALAVGFGAVAAGLERSGRAALLAGAVVLTHPLADLLSGTIPLWPGGPTAGLGLFHHVELDVVVEMGLGLGGWALYRRSLPPAVRDAWAVLVIPPLLLALQVGFLWVLRMSHWINYLRG